MLISHHSIGHEMCKCYNSFILEKGIRELNQMTELLKRITINPKQCGGRPCIRGMRIRVSDVLDLFVAGLNVEEMPDLERDDLKAALAYASRKLNHPVLVA
jgi:uncharacterized protein (DUF433 family)